MLRSLTLSLLSVTLTLAQFVVNGKLITEEPIPTDLQGKWILGAAGSSKRSVLLTADVSASLAQMWVKVVGGQFQKMKTPDCLARPGAHGFLVADLVFSPQGRAYTSCRPNWPQAP